QWPGPTSEPAAAISLTSPARAACNRNSAKYTPKASRQPSPASRSPANPLLRILSQKPAIKPGRVSQFGIRRKRRSYAAATSTSTTSAITWAGGIELIPISREYYPLLSQLESEYRTARCYRQDLLSLAPIRYRVGPNKAA